MKRLAALAVLAALSTGTEAFELNPLCHDYYKMFLDSSISYEDAGKIADAMHGKQCWPALQGLLPDVLQPHAHPAPGDLPNCESMAESLIRASDNIHKLYDVRPMTKEDCWVPPAVCNDPKVVCNRDISSTQGFSRISNLRYNDGHDDIRFSVENCDLLVDDPQHLAQQHPGVGFRPVNCRGKVVYTDGYKASLYFYLEQYPDGDTNVWGANVDWWEWR